MNHSSLRTTKLYDRRHDMALPHAYEQAGCAERIDYTIFSVKGWEWVSLTVHARFTEQGDDKTEERKDP